MKSEQSPISVRSAVIADIEAMTQIYGFHVRHGTGSFEENEPDSEEMLSRYLHRESMSMPTLVAENDGVVVGFAYASYYKERSAYRFTVEDSIYVAPDAVRQGIGSMLLNGLVKLCAEAGFQQMMGIAGDSRNLSSIRLHEQCGFSVIGTAKNVGFKHDRWLDIVFMQRSLQTGSTGSTGSTG